MAFTAKILSWRFRHLNIVGCLLKRRPIKEGSRHPRTPPTLATPLTTVKYRLDYQPLFGKMTGPGRRRKSNLC